MNNKRNLLITIITLSLILILGSSYAYLMYTKESSNNYVINVGTLEVTFVDSETQFLNLTNMYPMTDEEGESLEQELVFQVKNTGNLVANYNVYIEELSTEPEFKTVIKYIVNKDNKGYSEPKVLNDDKYIENNGKLKVGETSEYHVKVWLMETADITYMNKEFKAKVIVEGNQNLDKEAPLYDVITAKLDENNSIEDEDGTIYLSGDNKTINFNYVWYSGKLWRITAINPDGSVKLVTQDEIASFSWGPTPAYGKNPTFENSWVRQWLNEDFLSTLYNYENIIVQNANWNATLDETKNDSGPPVQKPETLENQEVVQDVVGLLSAYEYYQSYKILNTPSSGYLNIGYYWSLITPASSIPSLVFLVDAKGLSRASSHNSYGIRPSIILKSGIKSNKGDGSKENPYLLVGDIEKGMVGEKVNTRVSGEYINVDNNVYRIVDIENDIVKLTSNDYIKDNDEIITKKFGSTIYWKNSVTSNNDDYVGYYLNNTWLTDNLKQYITTGTYYLEQDKYESYKNTICNVSNTSQTTKECVKTSNTWSGLVGLPRIGEMFSVQLVDLQDDNLTNIFWLLTPYKPESYSEEKIKAITLIGNDSYYSPSSQYAIRPSIFLKSEVIITGGDGVSPETAYEVGLPKQNKE